MEATTSVIKPPSPNITPPTTQSTTSTSAASATAIPDKPGALSPTARLEEVETITVGEEDLVVVVEDSTIPTDAQRGAQALEIWLVGGNAGTSWEMFTSEDPDGDGWRWAAINQTTGTVVYIR